MSQRLHHPGCPETDATGTDFCICDDLEDQLVGSYVPVREDLSTPVGPYSSLASMIRQARRDGLLKPVQNYVDRSPSAQTP